MENTNEKQVTGVEIAKPVNSELGRTADPVVDYVQTVELTADNMAEVGKQLDAAQAMPFDLTEGYWSPSKMGETKKILLQGVRTVNYLREETGEVIELETAYMVEVVEGVAKTVTNASWKLVKALKAFKPGSAFLLTYLGKQKNRSNQNSSDTFSIKPLMIKQ
jgi:hypothetical protein